MKTDETESRLQHVQQNLLSDMEAMQAALPENGEETSEALERRARIVTMLTRAFDVLHRAHHQKQNRQTDKSDRQSREALIEDIEQKLARLAQSGDETPPAPAPPAAPPLFTTDEAIFEPARGLGSLAIPSHVTLLGVSMRVLDKISGPTNWKLGTNIDKQRFGHGLDVARGATTRAPSDPPAVYWSSENIVLTPGHGRFTGGRVAVAIHYIRLPVPTLS
jgi:hypothetical protein